MGLTGFYNQRFKNHVQNGSGPTRIAAVCVRPVERTVMGVRVVVSVLAALPHRNHIEIT